MGSCSTVSPPKLVASCLPHSVLLALLTCIRLVDWSNVVMAGGGVLGIVTGKKQSEAYDKSDIDLLLYGLQPDEVNR